MSSIDITPELLTAYALGEASPTEHAVITAHLLDHPHDREEVAAIRAAAGVLTHSLAHESSPGLDEKRRAVLAHLTITSTMPIEGAATRRDPLPLTRLRLVRFPHRVVWPSLVAACLVIGIVSQNESPPGKSVPEAATTFERHRKDVQESPASLAATDRQIVASAVPESASATPATLEKVPQKSAGASLAVAPAVTPTNMLLSAVAAQKTTENESPAGAFAALADQDPAEPLPAQLTKTENSNGPTAGPASRGAGIAASENGETGCVAEFPPPAEVTQLLTWHRTAESPIARLVCAPTRTDEQLHEAKRTDASAPAVETVRRELAAGHWPTPAHLDVMQLLSSYSNDEKKVVATEPLVHLAGCRAPWNTAHIFLQISLSHFLSQALQRERPYAHFEVLFNPHSASSWRLLAIQDTSNASITALYEIIPPPGTPQAPSAEQLTAVLAHPPLVTMSWLLPHDPHTQQLPLQPGNASDDALFAASVVEFAFVLQRQPGVWSLSRALQAATASTNDQPARLQFLTLIRQAQAVQTRTLQAEAVEVAPAP